jgi:hypothetical protein
VVSNSLRRRFDVTEKKKQQADKKEKKLKLDKRPLDDLPLKESEEQDVKGGRAPPYSPVGPNRD